MKAHKSTLIIDGHNYLYRAYYGLPTNIKLPNGEQGNAVYGFLAFLRRMVEWVEPENVVIVFDSETGTKDKLKEVCEYKSNRQTPDPEMFIQLLIIQKILEYLNILIIEDPDYEADDIIGSLVYQQDPKNKLYISSGDNDFTQLINPNIHIIRETNGKPLIINESIIYDKYHIKPSQYVDYISLKGDSSDNITGVKGIGKITAQNLLERFDNIPEIIKNVHKLPTILSNEINQNEEYLVKIRNFLKINQTINLDNYLGKYDLLYNKKLLLGSTNGIIKETGYII